MEEQDLSLLRQISATDWQQTPASVRRLVESLVANTTLSQHENYLIPVLDATPIGIALHNAQGELIYINNQGRSLLTGFEQPLALTVERLSQTFQVYREGTGALYPPDQLPSSRALLGQTAWADDVEVHRRDRVVPLEVSATPILDEQDQVRYVVAVFRDISDRKRQELEQQILTNTLQQEQRYRQFIQAQQDLILRSRADTRILFANPALCQALGLTLDQVIDRPWSEVVPPADLAPLLAQVSALTPENPTFQSINRNYLSQEQVGWIQWLNLGIFDENGALVEIQSVGRDVTLLQEQIQREQALNRVFQAIRNSLDLETIFATATAETAQLLGQPDCYVVQYCPELGRWRHVAEFLHDANRPSVLGLEVPDVGNPFAAQLKQHQIVCLSDTALLRDPINQKIAQSLPGAWLLIPLIVEEQLWGSFTLIVPQADFEWTESQIQLAQAVADQLEVAIQQANLYQQLQAELQERQRVEQALRESETRFQNMSANVPGAIFRYILRTDGTESVLYMSPGCYSLWEVSAEQVIADTRVLWEVVHPDDVRGLQDSVLHSAQTLEPWSFAWRITTPSGQEKWLEAAGQPVRQANGDVIWDSLILDVSARKQAEQRFQNLAANMPGVIYQYVLYPDGSDAVLYASLGCQALLELSAAEFERNSQLFWAMVHPEDRDAMRESIQISAQTLQPWNQEWRVTTPSGQLKWLQGSSRPEKQTDDRVIWDGLIIDISDRKQAELAIQQENLFRQQIVENMAEGLCVCHDISAFPGVQFTIWNQQMQVITGYTLEEINRLGWYQSLYPDPNAQTQARLRMERMREGESLCAEEWEIQRKDGQKRQVTISTQVIRNITDATHVLAIIQDVTERKQAEVALRASEAKYRQLIETADEGVWMIDADGMTSFVNPKMCQILGYTAAEIIGKSMFDFMDEAGIAIANHNLDRRRQGDNEQHDFKFQHKTGADVWALISTSGIFDEMGCYIGALGMVTDITARKATEAALKRSENRFRTLFESTPKIAVQGYNRDREVIYWNQASALLYGYSEAEAFQQKLEDLIIPEPMRQAVIEGINNWLENGEVIPAGELQLLHKDGSLVSVYSSHIMLNNADGEPEMYCVDIDLRDREQAQQALIESENRYRLLAENMNDLVCLHDLNYQYVYVSPSCQFLLGYDYQEMLGKPPFEFIHPDDRDRVQQEVYAAIRGEKNVPITYRMRRRQGQYIWFETLTKPIRDCGEKIVQLQTTSRDVTERIQVQNRLQYQALHDALTGLPNRSLLMERLELAIHRAERSDHYRFAVLFMDLDRFKVINDSLGHLAGDQLLIIIAQRLQSTVRSTDLAVRLGGDEFVILLEEITGLSAVVHLAERILSELQKPMTIQGREVYSTASMGIVIGQPHYTQASQLLRDADIAMYRAKNRGKARYEIFDRAMYTQALNQLHLENDLRRAIENQEFVLFYQPIFALATGQLIGFEALLRWQHPTDGLKAPDIFIELAEEIGLITGLDQWTLQTACQQLGTWQRRDPKLARLKMNVNLSVQDLRRADLVMSIDRAIETAQIAYPALTLEITESMVIDNVEQTIDLLQQLQARGIQISIDDFGTGYSSLSYLHRLPVNSLKVDRSFVGQMLSGQRNYQIVETIFTLSQQLEISAIAEGIETAEQLEQLRQLGYQMGQGYFFAKPLSVQEVETQILKEFVTSEISLSSGL